MIEVHRNNIIIRNVDIRSVEYDKFVKAYSEWNKLLHKYESNIINKIGNDIYIPSSIGVDIIKRFFPTKEVVISYNNTVKPKQLVYTMLHKPRDEIQQSAITFLQNMKTDNNCKQRFLALVTGSGKTFVTITMIGWLRVKSLIVVDTERLATQWKEEFLKHSNIDPNRIIILSGADSIEEAINNSSNYDVFIGMHATLLNVMKEDYNAMNNLMAKLGIGFRIFDEAHTHFKNICKINALSNVEYTLYLTATPSRSAFRDDQLYGKVFRKIPYFNGKELNPITNYCDVILYKFDSEPDERTKYSCKTQMGFSAQLWARWIEGGGYDNYLECLKDIFTNFKLKERDKKIAIILPTINLIEKTKQDLEDFLNVDVGLFVGSHSSGKSVSIEEKTSALEKKVFITNTKMFDKAIDVPDLEILINFVPMTSEVTLEQLMGRIRYRADKAHIFIDITDVGFPSCKKQLYTRKQFYKKHAKSIREMKI